MRRQVLYPPFVRRSVSSMNPDSQLQTLHFKPSTVDPAPWHTTLLAPTRRARSPTSSAGWSASSGRLRIGPNHPAPVQRAPKVIPQGPATKTGDASRELEKKTILPLNQRLQGDDAWARRKGRKRALRAWRRSKVTSAVSPVKSQPFDQCAPILDRP